MNKPTDVSSIGAEFYLLIPANRVPLKFEAETHPGSIDAATDVLTGLPLAERVSTHAWRKLIAPVPAAESSGDV